MRDDGSGTARVGINVVPSIPGHIDPVIGPPTVSQALQAERAIEGRQHSRSEHYRQEGIVRRHGGLPVAGTTEANVMGDTSGSAQHGDYSPCPGHGLR